MIKSKFGKSDDYRGAFTTFRTVPIDNGTCWDMFIGCVAVVEYLLLFLRVEHPVGQRQMGGRGSPSNYYAITHKPIDLDWTPGGVLRDRGPVVICYKTAFKNSKKYSI